MAAHEVATAGETPQSQTSEFPDLDDAGLAARLRQSVSTVRAWRSRNPDRLPPGVRVGRVWLYDRLVVEQWLAAKRQSVALAAAKVKAAPTESNGKRRGKPSRQEVAAAKAMGLTVPAWRALQKGVSDDKP